METKELDFVVAAVVVVVQRATDLVVDQLLQHRRHLRTNHSFVELVVAKTDLPKIGHRAVVVVAAEVRLRYQEHYQTILLQRV